MEQEFRRDSAYAEIANMANAVVTLDNRDIVTSTIAVSYCSLDLIKQCFYSQSEANGRRGIPGLLAVNRATMECRSEIEFAIASTVRHVKLSTESNIWSFKIAIPKAAVSKQKKKRDAFRDCTQRVPQRRHTLMSARLDFTVV